jgi:hypothetical protein
MLDPMAVQQVSKDGHRHSQPSEQKQWIEKGHDHAPLSVAWRSQTNSLETLARRDVSNVV